MACLSHLFLGLRVDLHSVSKCLLRRCDGVSCRTDHFWSFIFRLYSSFFAVTRVCVTHCTCVAPRAVFVTRRRRKDPGRNTGDVSNLQSKTYGFDLADFVKRTGDGSLCDPETFVLVLFPDCFLGGARDFVRLAPFSFLHFA